MTQYVINIGSLPNDGTGDPLRTAFNETNLNFDQVFAAGPVLSNIRIANNTILTTNTNGNLVLAPNGVGRIQANATVVPSMANVRDLGSLDRRWNTVYSQYLNISGTVSLADLTVNGNLTVTGNTIQIGNITTETKTIQLANAASTANAANGSGVTVGANDDIATMLYSSTSNTWNTNIGVSSVGNITAPYFIGNGSLLTGITSYANANAVAYGQSGWAGNIIPSGNAVYNLGNATNQWNDLYVSNATIFMNNIPLSLTAGNVLTVNGEPVLINDSTTSIATTGNITADYFFGDGSQLTGIAAGTGNLDITGTTISIANGAPETYINLSASVEGWAYVQVPTDATANVYNTRIHNDAGNIEFGTGDYSTGSTGYIWTLGNEGTTTIPGLISSSNTIEINNLASGNAADIQLYSADDIVLQARDRTLGSGSEGGDINIYAGDSAEDGDSSGGDVQIRAGDGGAGNVDFGGSGGFITIQSGRGGSAIGNSGATAQSGGSLTLNAGDAGDNNGNIDLGASGGDVYIEAGYSTGNTDNGGDIYLTTGTGGQNGTSGSVQINIPGYGNTTGGTWTFGPTGNLNLPTNGDLNFNGGSIAQTLNEDIYIRASDDESDGWSIYNVVDDGADNILSQTRLEFDQYTIRTDAQGAAYTWAFRDTGVLELPGDIYGNVGGNLTVKIGDSAGSDTFIDLQTRSYVGDALISNIRIANPNVTVSTASGVYNWNFDNTGNLNLPLSGNLVGTTPNNNGYINWLGNSSGDLNGYTTLRLVPDDTRESSDQYLIVDPTAPGHIHIRAGGTQDNSGADLFLGGENSYFRVASGANSAASVSANSYVWTYGTDGTFSLPAAESPGQYSEITSVGNSSGDGNGYATLQLKPDSNVGGDSYLIIDPTAPNHIHIRAGGAQDNSGAQLFLGGENSYFLVENGANSNVYVASNSNQWKFDTTGILTLPGEGVLQSLNDTVTLLSLNTTTGNANSVYLGTSGGLGFNDQAIGGNWLEIFRSGSDPEIRVPTGGGNILITGASGSGGASGRNITITAGPADQTNYYTTAGGTVNIVGGLGATDDGGGGGPGGNVNITAGVSADPAGRAGNVNITCGPNSWVFDYSGNVTIPGNINAVLSSPAPSLNGFNNVNAVNVNASGNISGTTAGYAIGYRDIPQVAFTGNATIATTDAGKHFYSTQSSNYILTIANNASQGFQVGAAITVVNQGTGTISIAQGSGVTLYLAGNATSGNRTVATFGMATIMKVATDTWFINGTGVS